MIFYPAIDLKDGKCVRLIQGNMNEATVFSNDPVHQALTFEKAGCKWLHLIDLNGAISGHAVNVEAIEAIVQGTQLSIQLGGGVRNLKTIEKWFSIGVNRIILGTLAAYNPGLVTELCQEFGKKIAIAIDARDGLVVVKGWLETTTIQVIDLASQFEAAGVGTFIYTNISRDGLMSGPDIRSTLELATAVSTPVILSGGISSIKDLVLLKNMSKGKLHGVISGRAIYDGIIDPAVAIHVLNSS
ncbi:MAG: 1-(5-phosphoribosyl)-5-[(5-phosphoribosylamino)methylideneamino] imidazole-4-carboxamide isomerase [Alphaproteobacteria bacterium MarineAlpha3_Bin5]|nr:1-(5-phosphoribosyl)-5-[(5-phosphoribosylamino)methylideneamino]imidazole-4-carboxamide isomerase [Magnetovibrio sp.]PPR78763.1 MAG: 1-(5-phosphoribosyl)-5-[(5-phosphoribosylamino)methylideneamino] imidazole-4-carboxamide isomerase [Alphaproteobacteria bacterium MarineAlpha3_Bin5]